MEQKRMNVQGALDMIDLSEIGGEMYRRVEELFPICRSITGSGVRETLRILQRHIALEINEVPSGTRVFDWDVPKEWNIRDAYVANSTGERIIDFRKSNLHVLNYSIPVRKTISLDELRKHLYSIPEHPGWIPYRTSYYRENWGFCTTHEQLQALPEDEYEIVIDSTLEPGSLTYGEFFLRGKRQEEVLISSHICHPSLCNDNLSGVAVATYLAKTLAPLSLEYSYRFLFIPGTIGSITWLARNQEGAARIRHGLVLAGIGDAGGFTYKKSRQGDAEIDRAVARGLKDSTAGCEITDFVPYGYDERQFCSPGFNLPVGCLMRTPHNLYPEYHTSADDLGFVGPGMLAESFRACLSVFSVLERNRRFVNLNPKCEPQLGRRGLYQTIGGHQDSRQRELAMLWVLNLSDGTRSLLDIADRADMPFAVVADAADALESHGLLRESGEEPSK